MGVTGNTTIPRASEGASEGVLSLLGRLGWEGGAFHPKFIQGCTAKEKSETP